jgi:membrane peptidoglycan carboxypeptidase
LKEAFPTTNDTEMFDSGGVKVKTTLDLDLQKAAVQALHQLLPSAHDPEAAVAAVDPRTGDIRAIATKQDHGYKKQGFNLAQRIARNSGSTIKPFTLAAALEQGHSLNEAVSAPYCVEAAPGYQACNAERGSSYQTLRTGLIESINTVYAPLAIKVGLPRVFALAEAAGLDISDLKPSAKHPYPSYALGVPTNPLSEAVAYGTLVDHGVHHTPNSVLDVHSTDDGDLFDNRARAAGTRVMPRKIADEVTSVLADVVNEGTGTAARQTFPVYGKTGTTDNFTNAWFTGCTPSLCISIWMGYNKEYVRRGGKLVPHSMMNVAGTRDGVFGGTIPAEIFAKVFSNYRRLQAEVAATASPSPSATVQPTVRATHSATATVRATPSRSHPTQSPSTSPSTPSESPSPTPSRSLLPTPP